MQQSNTEVGSLLQFTVQSDLLLSEKKVGVERFSSSSRNVELDCSQYSHAAEVSQRRDEVNPGAASPGFQPTSSTSRPALALLRHMVKSETKGFSARQDACVHAPVPSPGHRR